jgi:5'-nucleotidase
MIEQPIALFDMDGTLCDYDGALDAALSALRSPKEPTRRIRDREPKWLKARMDLIRSRVEWWEKLPMFKLGFHIWELAGELNLRRMILTQGPKRNPNAWVGKKLWIDRNLGQDTEVTITRDKGLVYGKMLVDDFPDYILKWVKWRPRGLVIMPASDENKNFRHPQVFRYDGRPGQLTRVKALMELLIWQCNHTTEG